MKYKIKYRGVPAYIDFDEMTIGGRNWWQNIIVRTAVFIDQLFIFITNGDRRPKHITIDEEEDEQ